MISDLPERVLLAQCKAGDHAAFTELILRNQSVALRAIRAMAPTPEDAEDIMQETLLRAYRNVCGFQERSSFSTWLTRIAINSALMFLRQRKKRMEISLDLEPEDGENRTIQLVDSKADTEQMVMRSQSDAIIRNAVDALSPTLQTYARRRYLEEESPQQVASSLGISLAAGKSRSVRAREKLESSLAAMRI